MERPGPCLLPSPPPPTPRQNPSPPDVPSTLGDPFLWGPEVTSSDFRLGGLREAMTSACGRLDLRQPRRGVQVDPPMREHRGGGGVPPEAGSPLPAASRDSGKGRQLSDEPLPPGPRTADTGPQRDGPRPSLEQVSGHEGELWGPPSPAEVQALSSWRGLALGNHRKGGHMGPPVKCASGV